VGFLRECLKRLPGEIKEISLRGDSGFFDNNFLGKIEKRGIRKRSKLSSLGLRGTVTR